MGAKTYNSCIKNFIHAVMRLIIMDAMYITAFFTASSTNNKIYYNE